MTHAINPDRIGSPLGAYSHGVATAGAGTTLQIAGQVGVDREGRVAASFEEQATIIWCNLVAILEEAGMGVQHLTKVNTYLTDMDDLPKLGPIRARYLGDARPASTLVAVSRLVQPDWLLEVDAVAFLPIR